MKILLTNDDGYQASGINILKEQLKKYGEVYMVAPFTHQSGKGASINCWSGYKVHKFDKYNYAVEGSPVDCVLFALGALKTKFDLVVSGCNEGWNISIDTMYSGTCGAAFQALIANKKTIAFSCKCKENFYQIEKYTSLIFDYIFQNNLLSKKYYLNINLPTENVEFKGIKITIPQERKYKYFIDKNNSTKDVYYIGREDKINYDENSDIKAVFDGYVSISPMGETTFSKKGYLSIERKLKRK